LGKRLLDPEHGFSGLAEKPVVARPRKEES